MTGMSEVVAELGQVREAFERPTLRLLDSKWAPVVLAVFRSSFGRENEAIAAERFHAQVDAYFDQLRFAGEDVPPGRQGRILCTSWVKGQWLKRTVTDDGVEEYALTSHAADALELVRNLTRERALISESRINMILKTVSDWALEVNPDREARLADYDRRIASLQSERDRIARGGVLDAVTDERMLDGWENLLQLVRSLPVDFKRVEESVQGMHRQLVTEFREEDRPIGEVLDDYLAKSDELMTMTRAGQAFDGAVALMRSDTLTKGLRENLEVLLAVPVTSEILNTDDEKDVRGIVPVIRRGVDDVLSQRSRLSATLRDHIVNHDMRGDRQLDEVFRDINRHLGKWMETAGPRDYVPVELLAQTHSISNLRENLYDPSHDEPLAPLAVEESGEPVEVSLDAIRLEGGPSLRDLRSRLSKAFGDREYESFGAFFNELGPDLRRPVEILGLLHLASQVTDLASRTTTEIYTALRTNGDVVDLEVPTVSLNEDEANALASTTGEIS